MVNNYDRAIELQKQGYSIYPLSPGTKIPLQGSNGWNDATNDLDQISNWWEEDSSRNVGLMLKDHHFIVIDLDRHDKGMDGVENCKKLWSKYDMFPPTYVEATPGNGIHFFFKLPDGVEISQETGAFKELFGVDEAGNGRSGIDVITYGIPIAPSIMTNGTKYISLDGKTLNDTAMAPGWLIDLLQGGKPIKVENYRPVSKTNTAMKLDLITSGAGEGGRNDHLTSLCGWLLWHGVDNETLVELIYTANAYNSPPLDDKEVNKIIKSMIKKDVRGKVHGS
ncbi:bifunctional DNA primase/polymerase [Vagococcus luciliae]|uniref:DNA primase n=1 Tax=Vagococcus luciliae TaxID=2920380 RepID=A0ABY5NWP1_9ENTE|nr:bifunctional DNA primase/polymerase [Vagococcus luciliae]UUV97992.1 hypothetical protein G314FT_00830 [Vagococcus luciliae]